eukprot:TRINITY_DN2978_c0_g1_i1.p1 TRINITY_DN2978_c0_g1~~TRINITY_DN2978_c0_g1_i1.p1  ORF type:complete len:501 (-),score=155.76 TRINITY_DN2978_c0_g1_i1:160-1611(-)
MRTVLFCLVLATLSCVLAQNGINTGEGLQALLFPVNGGGVELATLQATQTLSVYLPLAFTWEGWIMLPSPPADGYYKTMVSRWDIGPDNTFHNRWADFDFQVQASGTLNFFMGNGAPSIYGFNLGVANLAQGQWYHVAFAIECCGAGTSNPSLVRVWLDLVEFNQTWSVGSRQFPSRGRNLFLGDFFNHDGDHKWWRGFMDEVRFWGHVRNVGQLAQYRQRVVPSSAPGLLAYYRFNEGSGILLLDSSPNKYHGRLSKPVITTTSPLWRVSGVKIHVDAVVSPLGFSTLTLPGISPTGAFTYTIESLPAVDGIPGSFGTLIGDGKYVTSTPFALTGNTVSYEAGNVTGVTAVFSYYGTQDVSVPSQRERLSTIVYVRVGEIACIPDACGVCNGDNSTCSCLPLPYAGYSLNDVERILALYEMEQTLDYLHDLDLKLERAQKSIAQYHATELQTLVGQAQGFLNRCVTPFCEKVGKYSDGIAAL